MKKGVTLEDVMREKEICRESINRALVQFYENTGIVIDDIDLQHERLDDGSGILTGVYLSVKV